MLRCPTLTLSVITLIALTSAPSVDGHGRLIQPPARSTAWRYGFPTPVNYNDHETYCGGYGRQWGVNGGKCGPCGDPWDDPQPRANEEGGKYGLGVITATYKQGAEVEIGVELTANHNGFFEFRLCPHNDPKTPVTNECLDKHVLQKIDQTGPKYHPPPGTRKLYTRYRLPAGMTCTQCVLQWRYVTASNWGTCEDGSGRMGCGPQEEFRACADISIIADDGSADDTPAVVPDIPPAPTDEDYNEVDTDRLHETEELEHTSNFVGHVVALTLAFLLLPLLLLLLVLYFYFARDRVRIFVKKNLDCWKKTVGGTAATAGGDGVDPGLTAAKSPDRSQLDFPNPPFGVPPAAPPRRNRGRSPSVSPTQEEVRSAFPNPV